MRKKNYQGYVFNDDIISVYDAKSPVFHLKRLDVDYTNGTEKLKKGKISVGLFFEENYIYFIFISESSDIETDNIDANTPFNFIKSLENV